MGGGSSGPTQQQQDLQTEQALTSAQLNLEENEQRKVILNAMQGTRAFRGSALTRAVAGNGGSSTSPTAPAAPAPSNQQQNYGAIFTNSGSLLDQQALAQAGSPAATGTGTSGVSIGRSSGGGGGGGRALPK